MLYSAVMRDALLSAPVDENSGYDPSSEQWQFFVNQR